MLGINAARCWAKLSSLNDMPRSAATWRKSSFVGALTVPIVMKVLLTTGTTPQPPVSVAEIARSIGPDAKVVRFTRKARPGEAKQIPIANSARGGWTHPKTAELLRRSLDVSAHNSGNLPLVEQAEANIMVALPA
jgi:hypothetical protein